MRINDNNFYDAVILGAGPAGCSAGSVLAQHGRKTLIMDTKNFPRDKVCGGLLTQKSYDFIHDILHITNLDSVIESKSNCFSLYERDQLINKAVTGHYTYFVSRFYFDKLLLDNAIKLGCHVIDGIKIIDIDINNKAIITDHGSFAFNYLLGADGVQSIVGKSIHKPLAKNSLAIGLQAEIPLTGLYLSTDWHCPNIFFGYVKYGWAWVFPKKDHITVGLAGLINNASELRSHFNQFIRDLGFTGAIEHLPIKGGIVPYGTYINKPARQGVFLLGDAAGFAEPITGEGIYYALRSGLLAAESILSDSTSKEAKYISQCNELILNDLKQAKLARILLFNQPFHSIFVSKIKKNTKHMLSFMEILSGEVDYKGYFLKSIKRKLGLTQWKCQ